MAQPASSAALWHQVKTSPVLHNPDSATLRLEIGRRWCLERAGCHATETWVGWRHWLTAGAECPPAESDTSVLGCQQPLRRTSQLASRSHSDAEMRAGYKINKNKYIATLSKTKMKNCPSSVAVCQLLRDIDTRFSFFSSASSSVSYAIMPLPTQATSRWHPKTGMRPDFPGICFPCTVNLTFHSSFYFNALQRLK